MTTADSLLRRRELLLLLVLAGVQFTHIMDFMVLMPLGPQLMRLFQIEPSQFSLLVSAYTFSAGISGFLAAFIVDRFDRKRFLFSAYIGFAVATLACAMSPNYEFLLISRCIAGTFGGALGSQVMAIVGDSIPQERRGRAMGIVMASFSVASVFGVPFGLYLAGLFNWHAPFLFISAVAAVILFLIWWRIPPIRDHLSAETRRQSPRELLLNVARNRNQLLGLLLMALLMFAQFSIIPFLSPYMVSNVGFREDQLPFIYLVGGALTIFTSPIAGRLSDRFGQQKVFLIASILVLAPIWIATHLQRTSVPLALCVTAAFFVFNNGRFIPAMAMITSTVHPATRGSFMSLNSSTQSLSSAAASLGAGFVVSRSADGSLQGFGTLGLASILFSIGAIAAGLKIRAVEEKKSVPSS